MWKKLVGKMQHSMFKELHGDSSDTLAQVTKQATISGANTGNNKTNNTQY
jgi:hypothetical protein